MTHLIVGLDTGKTSAVVCLGLDRVLLFSAHKTFAGVDWLIRTVGGVGIPSIIACDKEPNDVARKVCAAFNARIFYPERLLTIEDKRTMARQFGIADPHERDACAAAVKAYNAYANKLKQAERMVRGMSAEDLDGIRAKIIERYSINEAVAGKEVHRR